MALYMAEADTDRKGREELHGQRYRILSTGARYTRRSSGQSDSSVHSHQIGLVQVPGSPASAFFHRHLDHVHPELRECWMSTAIPVVRSPLSKVIGYITDALVRHIAHHNLHHTSRHRLQPYRSL